MFGPLGSGRDFGWSSERLCIGGKMANSCIFYRLEGIRQAMQPKMRQRSTARSSTYVSHSCDDPCCRFRSLGTKS